MDEHAAVRPPVAAGYVATLEGMRGVAALAVVALHVGVYTGTVASQLYEAPSSGLLGAILSHGDIGVPIFFVLSGFFLYRPFAAATISGGSRPSVATYLWRRALRILPAYWVLTVAALLVFNREVITDVWDVLRPLLLLQTYEENGLPAGMGQTWSLAAEGLFYLLLPLFAMALNRFAGNGVDPSSRGRRLLVGVTALGAISIPYSVFTHSPALGQYPIQYLWLPEYLCYFAVGMALAVVSAWAKAAPRAPAVARLLARRPLVGWLTALLAFALILTPLGDPQEIRYGSADESVPRLLLYTVFAAALIAPLALATKRVALFDALLANPVMRFCGRVSYGVFLWHLFVVELYYQVAEIAPGTGNFVVVMVITLAGSLILAVASYVLVERPAQFLRGGRQSVPVVAAPLIRETEGRSHSRGQ